MFRAFMWVMAGFSFSGLVATNALAATGGEIRFQGAIVDGECSFSVRDEVMDGKCYQQGKFTRAVSPLGMMPAQETALPGLPVSTSLRWLNARRDAAVVTLTFK
jgi:type 1 fimbria pilin